jgi:hypothetical protein
MNKQYENKLTMYEGLWTFFGTNADIVTAVPMLKSSVDEFGTTLAAIHLKSSEVSTATTGKAAMKYKAEEDMIALLLPVSCALFVYAKRKGNAELMEKTRMTENGLRKLRDTELAGRAETIAALAGENAAYLAPAKITEDTIADLKIQVDAYRKALGDREKSVAERKGARMTLEDQFDRMDDLLEEEIDPEMELIRASNTEFYNKYFALRVVKDTGIRHRPEAVPAPGTATAQ